MADNEKKLVFIVDDDRMYTKALSHQLKSISNLEVKTYSYGEAFLQELWLKPDVVVLDYNLNTKFDEAMNGIEVLQDIKKKNPDITVILVSGKKDDELVNKAREAGARDFIEKDAETFSSIKQIVSETEARREGDKKKPKSLAERLGLKNLFKAAL